MPLRRWSTLAERQRAYTDLRAYLDDLQRTGELRSIEVPVDPRLEMAAIADRVARQGGPALLFRQAAASRLPVAMNLFGSRDRVARALGMGDLEEAGERLARILDLPRTPRPGLLAKLAVLPQLRELASFAPRTVRSGPVQETVLTGDQVDLGILPVLTTWPEDAGPFITLPMVITRNPRTGDRNMGMYRMQVFDRNTTGMHWHRHKTGAAHLRQAAALGKRLEVAVALGGDPATMFAATAPLPEGMDELVFAGFLRGEPVELVKGKTVDLEVPARAEIVLEGYVDPAEPLRVEGPFGDHTGFYSPADRYPVFHVTAMTMRRDAIYPATVVGRPPMEDYWLGYATERIFLPLARTILPEIVDYHMPPEGVFHNLVFVSIDKQYPGHAHKVAHGLWGLGLMMLAKVIVVVDADVNVQDPAQAWWAALGNMDPVRDVQVVRGPADPLDHAAERFTLGGKMMIDGTSKGPEEGHDRGWPGPIVMTPEIVRLVERRWKEYGLD